MHKHLWNAPSNVPFSLRVNYFFISIYCIFRDAILLTTTTYTDWTSVCSRVFFFPGHKRTIAKVGTVLSHFSLKQCLYWQRHASHVTNSFRGACAVRRRASVSGRSATRETCDGCSADRSRRADVGRANVTR